MTIGGFRWWSLRDILGTDLSAGRWVKELLPGGHYLALSHLQFEWVGMLPIMVHTTLGEFQRLATLFKIKIKILF